MIRKLLLAGILIAATVLTVILLNRQGEPPAIVVPADDFTGADAEASSFNTPGFTLTWTAKTDAPEGGSYFIEPLIVMGDDDDRIVITAERTWCQHDRFQLERGRLEGNVVVRRYVKVPRAHVFDRKRLVDRIDNPGVSVEGFAGDGPDIEFVMTTDLLNFVTAKDDVEFRVWTERPVAMDGREMSLRGVGFDAADSMTRITVNKLSPYGAVLYNRKMALRDEPADADAPPAPPGHIRINAQGKLVYARNLPGESSGTPSSDRFEVFEAIRVRQIAQADLQRLIAHGEEPTAFEAGLDAQRKLTVTMTDNQISRIEAVSDALRRTYLFMADGQRAWVERFVFTPGETVLESEKGLAVQRVTDDQGRTQTITLNDFTRMTITEVDLPVGPGGRKEEKTDRLIVVHTDREDAPLLIDQDGLNDVVGTTATMRMAEEAMTVVGREGTQAHVYPKETVDGKAVRTGDYMMGDRIVLAEGLLKVTGGGKLFREGQLLTGDEVTVDMDTDTVRVVGPGTLDTAEVAGGMFGRPEPETSAPEARPQEARQDKSPKYLHIAWIEGMTYGSRLAVFVGKVNVVEREPTLDESGKPLVADGRPVLADTGSRVLCRQLDVTLAERPVLGASGKPVLGADGKPLTRTDITRMVAQDDVVVLDGGMRAEGDRLIHKPSPQAGGGRITELFGSPDGAKPARVLSGQIKQDKLISRHIEIRHDAGVTVAHGPGSSVLTPSRGGRIEAWWSRQMTVHELSDKRTEAEKAAEPGSQKIVLLGDVKTVQHDAEVQHKRVVVNCGRMNLYLAQKTQEPTVDGKPDRPNGDPEMEVLLIRAFENVVVDMLDPDAPGRATGETLSWRRADDEIVLVGSPEKKARAASGQNLIVGDHLTMTLFPADSAREGDLREVFVRGPGELTFREAGEEGRRDEAATIRAVWDRKAYFSMEKNVAFFNGRAELTRRTEVIATRTVGGTEVTQSRPVVDVLKATEQIQAFFREVAVVGGQDAGRNRIELQRMVAFGPRTGDVLFQRENQRAQGNYFVYEQSSRTAAMTNAEGTPVKLMDVESGATRGATQLIVRERTVGGQQEMELRERTPHLGEKDPFGFREVLD